MAIKYTWKITRLEVINKDNLEDVAVQTCFDVSGVDDNGKHGFEQGDVLLLDLKDVTNFISIEKVTEDQAVKWTKSALGENVSFYESSIARQIANQNSVKSRAINLDWISAIGAENE